MSQLLTIMLFTPAVFALIIMFLPSSQKEWIKWVGLVGTLIPLGLSWPLYNRFNTGLSEPQFVTRVDWIEAFNIQYYLGVDGISVMLVLLSTILFTSAIIVSWNIEQHLKAYMSLFLILETGVLGTFMALDLFLFFVFWELTLLPMYFLIGIWGGPRKEYAAIKFFLYTMFGSVLMLLGIIAVYYNVSPRTFSMIELMDSAPQLSLGFQKVLFALFAIGFAVKIPVFPFHTWLPDAHVEAPTPISVILAGILLKMGGYGFYRIAFPFFPEASIAFAWVFGLLGLINIVYGSLCAMSQQDMKKLVAYSSIGHMGYMLLGMFSFVGFGLKGGHFQMFTHGLSSGLLFLLVGVIYDRAHHRNIDGFGGLATQMPVYGAIMGAATFAGLGLPGFANFISEVFSFLGAFNSSIQIYAILGLSGIVLTAGYMLWMYQRIFFEEPNPEYDDLPDINLRELVASVPLVILLIVLGVYPMGYFTMINESIIQLTQMFGS